MDPATLWRKVGAQARALVYIDTSVSPRESIPITWNKEEHLIQKVSYDDRRDFCTHCDQNGHFAAKCPRKESPPDQNTAVKEGMVADLNQGNGTGGQDHAPEQAGLHSGIGFSPLKMMTEIPPESNPQPSCDSSDVPLSTSDKVISATSSQSAFGTLEAPVHSKVDNLESQHPQGFSPEDFAEVHEKLDLIHGRIPEVDLVKKKKKKKEKKCKPSRSKSDADTECWPSDDESVEELEQRNGGDLDHHSHLEDSTVRNCMQRKKKKLGKQQPEYAKSTKGKKHGLVKIIFKAPSASGLVLPEPSQGAGGGGR